MHDRQFEEIDTEQQVWSFIEKISPVLTQLQWDQIMFGRSVMKTNSDGSIERLDPMTDIDELMKNDL